MGPRAVERRNPGEILGGLIPHARFTTVMILLINTALFLAQYLDPAVRNYCRPARASRRC